MIFNLDQQWPVKITRSYHAAQGQAKMDYYLNTRPQLLLHMSYVEFTKDIRPQIVSPIDRGPLEWILELQTKTQYTASKILNAIFVLRQDSISYLIFVNAILIYMSTDKVSRK